MRKDILKKLTTLVLTCFVGVSVVHCDPPLRLMNAPHGESQSKRTRARMVDPGYYLEDAPYQAAGPAPMRRPDYESAALPARGPDDRMVAYGPVGYAEKTEFQSAEERSFALQSGDNIASVTKNLRDGLDDIQLRLGDLRKILEDATEKTSAQQDSSAAAVGEMRADLSQEKLKLELRNSQ